jgi:hypothetical protein
MSSGHELGERPSNRPAATKAPANSRPALDRWDQADRVVERVDGRIRSPSTCAARAMPARAYRPDNVPSRRPRNRGGASDSRLPVRGPPRAIRATVSSARSPGHRPSVRRRVIQPSGGKACEYVGKPGISSDRRGGGCVRQQIEREEGWRRLTMVAERTRRGVRSVFHCCSLAVSISRVRRSTRYALTGFATSRTHAARYLRPIRRVSGRLEGERAEQLNPRRRAAYGRGVRLPEGSEPAPAAIRGPDRRDRRVAPLGGLLIWRSLRRGPPPFVVND